MIVSEACGDDMNWVKTRSDLPSEEARLRPMTIASSKACEARMQGTPASS